MAWIYLGFAGLLEIVWAYAMKESQGFTRPGFTALMVVAMIGSFGLLAVAMRTLPLGTSYMIWTGIGAVGAFIVGVFVFSEPLSLMRVSAAILIVTGLIMMKFSH